MRIYRIYTTSESIGSMCEVVLEMHCNINHWLCVFTKYFQYFSRFNFDNFLILSSFFLDQSCQEFINILISSKESTGHSWIRLAPNRFLLIVLVRLFEMSLTLKMDLSSCLSFISQSLKRIYLCGYSILEGFTTLDSALFFHLI